MAGGPKKEFQLLALRSEKLENPNQVNFHIYFLNESSPFPHPLPPPPSPLLGVDFWTFFFILFFSFGGLGGEWGRTNLG